MMDIPEEQERDYSEIRLKHRHIIISRRDTIKNDLKNSTAEGLISFISALVSLGLLIYDIYISYRAGGNAGYLAGILPIVSLILAIEALVLGIHGLKNRKKIRHYMEIRGIILGIIVIAAVAFLFIKGLTSGRA